jgi:hypothetical protein
MCRKLLVVSIVYVVYAQGKWCAMYRGTNSVGRLSSAMVALFFIGNVACSSSEQEAASIQNNDPCCSAGNAGQGGQANASGQGGSQATNGSSGQSASGGASGLGGANGTSGSAGTSSNGQGGTNQAGTGGTSGTAGAGASGNAGAGVAGMANALKFPAERLDLENWKLTLPIPKDGSSKPLEITQPDLATYSLDPYFHLTEANDGVVFRAHAGGATTSNSGYPRSELREMMNKGADQASWSTMSGKHTMVIKQAITHLPETKPHAVAGQIHDAADDVVMIRLEGKSLFVEGGGKDLGSLDAAYQLGTPFTIRIEAENGHIRITYNQAAEPQVDVARDKSGCYFKAGVYTQSNTSKGDAPEAYGEVEIYELSVIHE